MSDHLELNRQTWDTWTPVNYESEMYNVEGFVQGGNRLGWIERDALGDVKGKKLLHLQCHIGLDTLSWARLGAEVTGIDFSAEAIKKAQDLAQRTQLEATFIQSSVEELQTNLDDAFDIVFTSQGVLTWLKDLNVWAQTIHHFLKPGGIFFIAETHPTGAMYECVSRDAEWTLKYPYFESETPLYEEGQGTYANLDAPIYTQTMEWVHSLSEIFEALTSSGLQITAFKEYPFTFYEFSPAVERRDDGYYHPVDPNLNLPLMFSLMAKRAK